jgi:uncharacterized membrane protein HdeD (DUF308 family)
MGKEIISTFKEKPKTRTAWWAMGLGLATILIGPFLGIFASTLRPIIDKAISENTGANIGFALMIFSLLLLVVALVVSIRAFKKGERSWVMWLGLIPAILGCVFWIVMIAGEFIFPH